MLHDRWARNFTISKEDMDFLINYLLEHETPLNTRDLARVLINQRLNKEQNALQERFRNSRTYRPLESYAVGDRLVFPHLAYAAATVRAVRSGMNDVYQDFEVIQVEFDDSSLNAATKLREFAANLKVDHKLSASISAAEVDNLETLSADEIIRANNGHVQRLLSEALQQSTTLERVAGFWFPRDLVIECDIGILHLSEAVLDMANGGPLTTEEIIAQIGGIADAPMQLQIFSLNLALNGDDRFDEVGPAGQVLWYLNRMEPEAVRMVPDLLKYTPIEYDDDLLSDEMYDLETELDDENTPIDFEGDLKKARSILIYSHRRAGTLPLNAKNRAIFPKARTPRIVVELVDATDGQKFTGWVVHEHKYVYGLLDYYTKHRLPVGAFISAERGDHPGQIILSFSGHKPHTQWIRILTPLNNRIAFETKKRVIGAEYDDLIVVGVDELEAVDKMTKSYRDKPLATILRELIVELGKSSPQGTVHAVTLYSAVNVIRRCAPGPIFATLSANPDFEDVGNHYWKLKGSA
jgi:hypothetical protein